MSTGSLQGRERRRYPATTKRPPTPTAPDDGVCAPHALLDLLNEDLFTGGLTDIGFRSDRKSPRG